MRARGRAVTGRAGHLQNRSLLHAAPLGTFPPRALLCHNCFVTVTVLRDFF